MNRVESKLVKLILSIAVLIGAVACAGSEGTDEPGTGGSAILTSVESQASMLLTAGADHRIMAKGAEQGDVILLDGNKDFECEVVKISTTWFRFAVPQDIVDGKYNISIRRGEKTQNLFATNITVQSVDNRVPSKTGTNLKGMVYCNGKGVEDVLVTDGVEITKTNADGHYWINSKKSYEVVYVILPSGYNVPTQGAMPKYWAQTSNDANSEEQHNFELVKASNDDHIVLVATDIHLTNRNLSPNDCTQFRDGFVNELIAEYSGKQNVYCFNLGDFAHDIYWYRYDIGWGNELKHHPSDYISGLPCQFWSTMGNHDNDGHTPDGNDVDLRASGPYRKMVGPTHVSMNIGKIHYMLLDDILYYNGYTGSNSDVDALFGDCNYHAGFRPDMLTWIERDLSYVDKNTPIVIGLHIPLVNWTGSDRNYEFNVKSNWTAFMDLFKDFKEVNFITGHTHQTRFRRVPGYNNMYEHNIGAVCGVWWNSSLRSGGTNSKTGALNLCADGTPSGYYVYKASGVNRSWYYKYVGEPATKQFKSYDMNEVKKYYESYGPANSFINAGTYVNTANGGNNTVTIKSKEYGYQEEQNTVWINVWGYENGPFSDYGNWEVTVTENGKKLEVTQLSGGYRDPLSALCGEIYVYGVQGKKSFSANTCSSVNHNHLFRVVASSANSTLTINVKDRFGNVYQEQMARPKKFYDGKEISNTWTLD